MQPVMIGAGAEHQSVMIYATSLDACRCKTSISRWALRGTREDNNHGTSINQSRNESFTSICAKNRLSRAGSVCSAACRGLRA